MYLVNDLLELCKKGYDDKKIYLIIDRGENKYKIPMSTQYYVADDIFFFEVGFENKTDLDNNGFIDLLEKECINDCECWGNDIYYAPMDKIGDCELRFAKNMLEIYEDNFDECFDIVDIKEVNNEIQISLK